MTSRKMGGGCGISWVGEAPNEAKVENVGREMIKGQHDHEPMVGCLLSLVPRRTTSRGPTRR